jgi:hypothetical protein
MPNKNGIKIINAKIKGEKVEMVHILEIILKILFC